MLPPNLAEANNERAKVTAITEKEGFFAGQAKKRQGSRNDLNTNIVPNLAQGKARDITGESAKVLKTS